MLIKDGWDLRSEESTGGPIKRHGTKLHKIRGQTRRPGSREVLHALTEGMVREEEGNFRIWGRAHQ